jgi:hypothetical protein
MLDLEFTLNDLARELNITDGFISEVRRFQLLNRYPSKSIFIGDINFVPIEESLHEDLKFWVKETKENDYLIKKKLLEYQFTPVNKLLVDVDKLDKQKKNNYKECLFPSYCDENPELKIELFWCLYLTLQSVIFEVEVTNTIIDNRLQFTAKKNKLINDYSHSLPEINYFNSLYDSYEKYEIHLLFFKKHLKNDVNKLSKTKKRIRKEVLKTLPQLLNDTIKIELLRKEYKGAEPKRKVCMLYALYRLEILQKNPTNIQGVEMKKMFDAFFKENKCSDQACNGNKRIFKRLFIGDTRKLKDTSKEADLIYFKEEQDIISNFL